MNLASGKLRVGVISGKSHLVDKAGWVAEGFEQAGCDVSRGYTVEDVIRLDDSCDLLVFDHYDCALDVPRVCRIADTRRAKWVQWWRDLVAVDQRKTIAEELAGLDLLEWSRSFDLVLVKERGMLDQWKDAGVRAVWFDQACPRNMPACNPERKPLRWDVLIAGCMSDRHARRDAAIALARRGFRVVWVSLPDPAGCPPGVEALEWRHPFELPELVGQAAVCLDVGQRFDVAGYVSDRMYLLGGAGGVVLQRSVPQAMDIGQVSFEDIDACSELVDRFSVDLEFRRATGDGIRANVMANHTFAERAKEIAHYFWIPD